MTLMGHPKLSIVVASSNAAYSIEQCLTSISNQIRDGQAEIIVVDSSTDGSASIVEKKFPKLNLIKLSEPNLIPELWSRGISWAHGDIVSLTSAHCVPDRQWISQILKAHESDYPAIGGAIENADSKNLVDWAIYFCRYTQYMKPFETCFVNDMASDNASYKRSALEACKDVWQDGFWEPFVHAKLIQDGSKILLNPEITTFHVRSFRFFSFIKQRFNHGYHFSEMRSRHFSNIKKVIHVLAFPVVPFLMAVDRVKSVLQKKRHIKKFLLSLPIMLVFFTSWALGEVRGYLTGR